MADLAAQAGNVGTAVPAFFGMGGATMAIVLSSEFLAFAHT